MVEEVSTTPVLDALLHELKRQGQVPMSADNGNRLTAYPVKGNIDLLALAEAVESAVRATTLEDDEARTPAELNAANDG